MFFWSTKNTKGQKEHNETAELEYFIFFLKLCVLRGTWCPLCSRNFWSTKNTKRHNTWYRIGDNIQVSKSYLLIILVSGYFFCAYQAGNSIMNTDEKEQAPVTREQKAHPAKEWTLNDFYAYDTILQNLADSIYESLDTNQRAAQMIMSAYRDAGSGQYVKKNYADKHPRTTVKERDRVKKGRVRLS